MLLVWDMVWSNVRTMGGGGPNIKYKWEKPWKNIIQQFDMFTCMETVVTTVVSAVQLKYINRRNINVSCLDESTSALSLYGRPRNFFKSQCIIGILVVFFNVHSCLCEMHQKVLCWAQMKHLKPLQHSCRSKSWLPPAAANLRNMPHLITRGSNTLYTLFFN